MTDQPKAIRLENGDAVAVVVAPVSKGAEVCVAGPGNAATLTASEDVPKYHKIALIAVPAGREVRRNGCAIGCALVDIGAGDWVHTHNLVSLRARGSHS